MKAFACMEERCLMALQMVFRKEEMGDARLARQEVLDRVWDEICNIMGSNEAVEWANDTRDEISDGNSD
jgi:uncharacterized protein YjaG (DUF416 family)